MCIFTQPVASVDTTQIFARTTSLGSQFLVYQMNYESSSGNAMILPLPVRVPAHDASVRFIDLQGYGDFFEHLARGFPYRRNPFDVSCSSGPGPQATLRVYEVGSYIASFVPSLSDFSRLDAQFTLPPATWSQLPQYADYGFAVFQLAAGELTPHPMAFEFESRDSSIYFPTVHVHDGAVHEWEMFDHYLYLQHAGFDSIARGYQNFDVTDEATGLVRSSDVASHFCDVDATKGILNGELLVHRMRIEGGHRNHDRVFATSGDPEKPTINWRRWWSWSPFVAIAAATMWFIRRRKKIMRLAADRDSDIHVQPGDA